MKISKKLRSLIPIYIVILCCFLFTTIGTNHVATALSENTLTEKRKCIIIDAGHGGEDGGATSCTGILESKINLEIALKLNDLFHLLGTDTIMIRQTDRSVYTQGTTIAARKVSDLKERVRIINEAEDAMVISIHQNHFSDSQYHGAQVFYSKTEGSQALAKQLQTSFIDTLNPGSHRQEKVADGIYLMNQINCTGVLVECGFLSNPEEEAKLTDAEYQKKLCCVLASVCSRFLYGENSVA